MQRFKAVLFDLDDTLYPERQYLLSGYRAVARYVHKVFGLQIMPEVGRRLNAGEHGDLCIAILKRHFKEIDDLLPQRLREIFHCHKPAISLYPDARICLATLAAKRIPTGLLTDYFGHVQRAKVRALQLEMLIDSFMYCDDLGGREFWRPNSEAFHIMAAQMDCDPNEFIFVGDDPQLDFIAPRQLGMGAIQVVRTDSEHAHAQAPNPNQAAHIRIPSLEMLWEAIQMLDRSRSGAAPEQSMASEMAG